MTETAPDIVVRNLPDQRQDRRVHGIRGEQRRCRIKKARTRNHGIGRRLAGRKRGAERHIRSALFVAGVDGGEPVGKAEQRVEHRVVLQSGQRVDCVEAMRHQRRDHGVGRRHFGRRDPGFAGRFPLHFHRLHRSVQISAVLSRQSWPAPLFIRAPVPRTRSSHKFAEPADANFGFKSGTTRMDLLVSLSIPKFVRARRKCPRTSESGH